MEAIVYVRHAEDFSHEEYKFWRRCCCRKWIYLPGEVRRISAIGTDFGNTTLHLVALDGHVKMVIMKKSSLLVPATTWVG
jgi:hypothetical protein